MATIEDVTKAEMVQLPATDGEPEAAGMVPSLRLIELDVYVTVPLHWEEAGAE